MPTRLMALCCATTLAVTTLQLAPGAPSPAAGAQSPTLTVAGGAQMQPAYSPTTSRYAVRPAADGSVRVDVTGASEVAFNGVPDPDGSATFTGLTPGEEISVFVGSGSQRRTHALYVLPQAFPLMSSSATGAPLGDGHVALTLDRFESLDPTVPVTSPRWEAIVDRQGVPVYTREAGAGSMDLKSQNGMLTVHRPTTTPGRTGAALVVLDDKYDEVRRIETTGLVDTDGHDSRLLPDGSRWLIAYEPNTRTGKVDSIIQHVSAEGEVLFDWSSEPHFGESVLPDPPRNARDLDYAHINSIEVQPNGDVLASFRHLSSVFLIASQAHDGHEPGDVIWKLGGRDSDFAFPDLPDGTADVGPCAQHTATILPNGNVLMFDNGSIAFLQNLCVDPTDPQGPPVARRTTRVVEFDLEPASEPGEQGVATVARTYGETDRFAWFMGSSERLANGNVLIGWSAARESLVTETDAEGRTVWTLAEVSEAWNGPPPYITYRSALVPARDGFDPEVTIDDPPGGSSITQGSVVPVAFSCTDRGGSTLQSCEGPTGRQLDTSTLGTHTWSVTARDGAGRTTTRSRSYTVVAAPPVPSAAPTPAPASPDLALRVARKRWVGAGARQPARQDARATVRPGRVVKATLRVRNVGGTRGRFLLRAPASIGRRSVEVTYVHRGVVRTRPLSRRGWRTPALAPGESLRVKVRVKARASARPGQRTLRVTATSAGGRDRVRLLVRVPKRM